MTTVPYPHHQDGRDYALQYVHATEADAIADRNEQAKAAIVRPLELDQRYYGVYTASTIEKHSTEAADLSDYDTDDTYLIDSILSIFDVIDDEQDLVWYKPLEPDRIADALTRVEWRQTVPNVAGQLLSNLILSHGLTNANHRTALGFLRKRSPDSIYVLICLSSKSISPSQTLSRTSPVWTALTSPR